MDDLIERLRALSRHEHDDLSIGDEAADEIERLQSGLATHVDRVCALNDEAREADDLRVRLTAILTGTANALKGELEPLHVHSWHDLAEVATKVVAERDALRARIEGALSGVVLQAGDDENGLARVIVHCSREALSSGPNLIGKRVALVVLE